MKNRHKLFVTILSLLSIGLVGCGNSNNGGDNTDKPAESTPIKTSDTAADDNKSDETSTITLTANSASIEMKIDSTSTLNALYTVKKNKGTPTSKEKKVTATSSDASIVKVTNATIKAVGVGKATLTITSSYDKTQSVTVEITVTEVYFDRKYSNVNSNDDFSKELPSDGGIVRTSGSTTADLYVKGVSSANFIANVTVSLHSVSSSEDWPKLGITCSTAENEADDTTMNNKMVFFLNAEKPHDSDTPSWTYFGICEVQNGSNWAWNAGVTDVTARHKDDLYVSPTAITYNTEVSMTMVRKGLDFHFFVNDTYAGSCKSLDSLFTGNGANLETMVGFFEFNSDVTFSKYSVETDATKVDEKIATITETKYIGADEWSKDSN